MSETGTVLRGRFAGVDLDELVDWPVVRVWLYWGCSGSWSHRRSASCFRASSTIPTISAPPSELTFGRLRPVHVNGVIFGAFSSLFIGECYYLVPRLCGVRVPWPQWGVPLAWVWNIVTAAALISLPFGDKQRPRSGRVSAVRQDPDVHRQWP